MRAQLLELLEALLEILALRDQLVDALLLALVLLLGEGIDLAERLPPPAELIQRLPELFAVVSLGGLGCGCFEPACRLAALGRNGRELDVDRPGAFPGFAGFAPEVRLGCSELPELGGQLARPCAAGIGARTERRFQPF